jgi:hypothetical protein
VPLAKEEEGKNDHREESDAAKNERQRAGGPGHGSLILSGFAGLVLCHALLLAIELSMLVMHPESARLLRLSPRVLDF